MLKREFIRRGPIRILEKSIQGGLGKGNMGVFTARKGVGKTACLVHVAIDKLLHGQKVFHITFADDPLHIKNWYKQVFNEVAKAYKLEDALEDFEEITNNRLILHFKQDDVEFHQIREAVEQFSKGMSTPPELFIVDGLPFDHADEKVFRSWKSFTVDHGTETWFSATLHREDLQFDDSGIPAPVNQFADIFSVIIMLNPMSDYVDFQLLKDHDSEDMEKLRLKLDPKTLMISNHRA